MDSQTPPADGTLREAESQLDELKRELAERYQQLAERWNVSSAQVERILWVLGERLPDYTGLQFIGAGGMGEVWRAEHKTLQRRVAIKLITQEAGTDSGFAERFLREAQALAHLDHPHIVRVYEFGDLEGTSYLVMEYVPSDLGGFLALTQSDEDYRTARKRVSAVLRLFIDLCAAVEYAHDHGVIHRDLKPANVLWDGDAGVKLADFGLARRLGPHEEDGRLTATDEVVGTLAYMAPEQLTAPDTVDHRADVYALGVLLYELLTGNLPQGRFEPPSVSVQDKRFDAVVFKALALDPAKRYQSVHDMMVDLIRIRDNPLPTRWGRIAHGIWAVWVCFVFFGIIASLWNKQDASSFGWGMSLAIVFGVSMGGALPRLRQPAWAAGCALCVAANLVGPLLGWERSQTTSVNRFLQFQPIVVQLLLFMVCSFVLIQPLAERARSFFRAAVLMLLILAPPLVLVVLSLAFASTGHELALCWMPLALLVALIGYIEMAGYQRQRAQR